MMTMMDVYSGCPDRAACCSEWAGFLEKLLAVRQAGPGVSPEQVGLAAGYRVTTLANVIAGAVFVRALREDAQQALTQAVVHGRLLMGEHRDTVAASVCGRTVNETLEETITELRAYARRRLN
jgi:hypothetical protein